MTDDDKTQVDAFITPGTLLKAGRKAQEISEREMADQVYRRLTLHLCGKCYRKWIEDPAGRPRNPD